MKHLAFFGFVVFAVPLMAALATSSPTWKERLLTLLVFSTVLGDLASINFVSMELYRGPDRGFEVTVSDLIALALAVGILLRPSSVRWIPPGSLWMAAFFCVASTALFTAPDSTIAAFTLWKMPRVFLLYWVVVNLLRQGTDPKAVWRGLIAAGLLVAFLAFKQKYLGGVYRVSGPFDHSNSVPLYLNLFLPVLLAWLVGDPSLRRVESGLTVVTIVGMTFAVLATFSRAGAAVMVAAAAAVLLPALLGRRRVGNRLAVGVVVMAGLLGASIAADSFIDRFRNAPESSAEGRDEFNRAAAAMTDDHFLGVGINSFPLVLTEDGRYRRFLRVTENEEQSGVAHHIYWLTAAETGVVGLLIYLGLMARLALLAWHGSRRIEGPTSALLWGSVVGFGALHAAGLFEWAFRITPVLYMWAIASALAVGLVLRADDEATPGEGADVHDVLRVRSIA